MVNEFKSACASTALTSLVTCSEYSYGNDVSKQSAQIDDLISSHVDAIVIDAASPPGLNVDPGRPRKLLGHGRGRDLHHRATLGSSGFSIGEAGRSIASGVVILVALLLYGREAPER